MMATDIKVEPALSAFVKNILVLEDTTHVSSLFMLTVSPV